MVLKSLKTLGNAPRVRARFAPWGIDDLVLASLQYVRQRSSLFGGDNQEKGHIASLGRMVYDW